MSRPKTRTRYLNPLASAAMSNLLGIQKAHNLLALEAEGVTYDAVRRAVHGEALTDEEHDLISLAWTQWSNTYLADPSRITFQRGA